MRNVKRKKPNGRSFSSFSYFTFDVSGGFIIAGKAHLFQFYQPTFLAPVFRQPNARH